MKSNNVSYEIFGAHKLDEFLGLGMERAFREYQKVILPIKLTTIQDVITYETPLIIAEYFGFDPERYYRHIIQAALQALNPQINDYMKAVNDKFNYIYHPGILFISRIKDLKKFAEIGGIMVSDFSTLPEFHPHLMRWNQFQSIRERLFSSSLREFFETQFSISYTYCQDWYSLSLTKFQNNFDLIYSIEQSKAFYFPYMYRIKIGQQVKLLWDDNMEPLVSWMIYSSIIYDLIWDTKFQVTCIFKKERYTTSLSDICAWNADERCGIISPTNPLSQNKNCPFEKILSSDLHSLSLT